MVRLFEADWCCNQTEHSNQFDLDRWIEQGWICSFRARSLAFLSVDHTRLLRIEFPCLDHVARFFRSFSRACGAAQESVELPTVRRASPAHAPPNEWPRHRFDESESFFARLSSTRLLFAWGVLARWRANQRDRRDRTSGNGRLRCGGWFPWFLVSKVQRACS
jgi:hypothetical protein